MSAIQSIGNMAASLRANGAPEPLVMKIGQDFAKALFNEWQSSSGFSANTKMARWSSRLTFNRFLRMMRLGQIEVSGVKVLPGW